MGQTANLNQQCATCCTTPEKAEVSIIQRNRGRLPSLLAAERRHPNLPKEVLKAAALKEQRIQAKDRSSLLERRGLDTLEIQPSSLQAVQVLNTSDPFGDEVFETKRRKVATADMPQAKPGLSKLVERRGFELLKIDAPKQAAQKIDTTNPFGDEMWEPKRRWVAQEPLHKRAPPSPPTSDGARALTLSDVQTSLSRTSCSVPSSPQKGDIVEEVVSKASDADEAPLDEERIAEERMLSFLQQRGFKSAGARRSQLLGKASSPLHCAVRDNDAVMVQLLLRFKADPNLVNAAGQTPYEYALQRNVSGSHKEVLMVLTAQPPSAALTFDDGKAER